MLFNSVVFIMLFLPLCLAGWYLLQKINYPVYAKIFLLAMSLWFYGYYNPAYLLVLTGSLLANFLFSLYLDKVPQGTWRKALFILSLFTNIGSLFYFKYFNFFLDNCNFLFHTDWQLEAIALPLGISFFTFQQLAFLVDRYQKKASHYSLIDYACFVSFFPYLTSGPITLHNEFIPQLQKRENRKLNPDLFFDGLSLFILGLAKKVLLADVLGIVVNAEYKAIAYLDAPCAWLTIIFYMFQLYFDFSGYSDMARGIGKMFGFHLPENFDSPFKAVSVKDFWRRWHKTLSRFLTSYIYIPLGGNRKGLPHKCVNLLIVFLVSGLWHGANWTFVVWGLLHGLAMVWEAVFPKLRFKWEPLNKLATFLFVTFTFSIFRSPSLSEAWLLVQKLFTGGFKGYFVGMCNTLVIPETYVLREALEIISPKLLNPLFVTGTLLLFGTSVLLIVRNKAEDWIAQKARTKTGLFILATLFTWAVISLSQVSTFLYFNF